MNDCKGNSSYWQTKVNLLSYSPLSTNEETDVCIVGAGIGGLTCAYLLAEAGKKVIILEKDKVGSGQTCKTTAHLTFALDDRYYDLEKLFGTEGASIAADSHKKAIDFIEQIIKKENIDCNFERVNAYLFVPPGESTDILEKEKSALERAGVKGVKIVSQSPITSFQTGPCLFFPDQGEFHPLKYINALAETSIKKGVKIYTDTMVTDFNTDEVITSSGNSVKAKFIIVATNSPINDRVFIHTKQAAYRTYVIAGNCPKGYVPKGLYYDTLDPYHYIRVVEEGNGKDLLMFGGEDHRTGQKKHPEECFENLEKWGRERFPLLEKIDYKWSGQIVEPVDSLAFIGKNPWDENVYIITGDSGNGLTHGTIGGILISDLIEGKKNPWESLYSPARKTLSALTEFATENVNTAIQYSDWIEPGSTLEDIKPNTGGIITKGIKKLAIYRDDEQKLHVFSAICPHLGGIVRWNSVEKTWDCPCHGSRFGCKGHVISGPAKSNLAEETL